jgi:hypothetical protein
LSAGSAISSKPLIPPPARPWERGRHGCFRRNLPPTRTCLMGPSAAVRGSVAMRLLSGLKPKPTPGYQGQFHSASQRQHNPARCNRKIRTVQHGADRGPMVRPWHARRSWPTRLQRRISGSSFLRITSARVGWHAPLLAGRTAHVRSMCSRSPENPDNFTTNCQLARGKKAHRIFRFLQTGAI